MKRSSHSVIDMGYLAYYYAEKQEQWREIQHFYSEYNGYVFANEGYDSIRKAYDPEYKENRKDYKNQYLHKKAREFWKDLLHNKNYRTLSKRGYEGDDVCALLALKEGHTIIGCDKDYLQLPDVKLERLDGSLVTINQNGLPKTIQHVTFNHRHWLLYLVLNGDKADNVKQLRGKGKKGLEQLTEVFRDENTMWERAVEMFGFDAIMHNLLLVLIPHPSLLDLYISDDTLFTLVAKDEYYPLVKKFGITI